MRQFRELVLGDGYGSQNSLRMHFGLNQQSTVDYLIVHWPTSKLTQTFTHIQANRILQITEGEADFVEKRYPALVG